MITYLVLQQNTNTQKHLPKSTAEKTGFKSVIKAVHYQERTM